MSTNDPGGKDWWGRVRRPLPEGEQDKHDLARETEVKAGYPPPSTLVEAFGSRIDDAADAVVLRGYAGRTTIARRALEFIDIGTRTSEPDTLDEYRKAVEALDPPAEKYILRIYLTPRLDRYVDFHRSCLIGWRYETSPQRQDAITVWLKGFDKNRVPIPYRVVQETTIGPSYANYIGGDLLDDYLGQPASQGSAWDSRSGLTAGGKWTTTPHCGE